MGARFDLGTDVEQVATKVVDAVYHVHRAIGPGALESVYQRCLAIAFQNRGLTFEREAWIDLSFEGQTIPRALRADFLVEDLIVVEVKAILEIHPVHFAQVISYLRASRRRLGFLVNFHVPLAKQGIHRVANSMAAE